MTTRKPSKYHSHDDPSNPYGLTSGELTVVKALAERGETQHALALRLHYSKGSINTHLWNAYRKMRVNSASEAAVKWIREQEIPLIASRVAEWSSGTLFTKEEMRNLLGVLGDLSTP
jgi:DNA-binding NarL/FixJ family response regulator